MLHTLTTDTAGEEFAVSELICNAGPGERCLVGPVPGTTFSTTVSEPGLTVD